MKGIASFQQIYMIAMWISLGVQFITIVILSFNRATEGQKYIVSAINEIMIYCIGCQVHSIGNVPEVMLIGLKIQYVASFFLSLSLYATFRQVYNENFSRAGCVFIFIFVIVLNIPLIGGSPKHSGPLGWFFQNSTIDKVGGLSFLTLDISVFRVVYIMVIGLFMFLQLIIFLKAVGISLKYKYKIKHSFFAVAFIPQISILLDLVLGWYKVGVSVVPFVCIVGAIICIVLFSKRMVTNLYDVSRSEVINSSKDPLFIIDNRFYVRYANNAAKVLFPEYKSLKDDSYRRLKACPELQNIITPPIHETLNNDEFLRIGKQVYEPDLHRLGGKRSLLGFVITLNDVTEQKIKNDILEQQNVKLSSTLRTTKNRTLTARDKLVSGAMQFVKDHSPDIAEHMRRTSNYTFVIARELRRAGNYIDILTDSYMETLGQVAPLHDVGKYMVPQELFGKTDLSEEEIKTLQSHAMMGMQMVDRMIVNNPDDLFYRLANEVTLCHHEWWNGSGYPKGIMEEEIPLSARIVAVADVFDALSARHASRNIYHFDEAFGAIDSFSGKRFDPVVVEAFKNSKEKLRELYDQMFQTRFVK